MSLRTVTVESLAAISGLVHGFERRPRAPGSPPETRAESRSRVASALAELGTLLLLRQVHGATVASAPWLGEPAADAAVASLPRLLLGIETADCLPILLVDPHRRLVAAAHAGWRGTAAGVAMNTVEALAARGSRPAELLAALGPAIGACCYEVGAELREAFGAEAEHVFHAGANGRLRLDLRTANERQLVRAGVPAAAISHVRECTYCREHDYHSFRRSGKGSGRMISYVGFRGEP